MAERRESPEKAEFREYCRRGLTENRGDLSPTTIPTMPSGRYRHANLAVLVERAAA